MNSIMYLQTIFTVTLRTGLQLWNKYENIEVLIFSFKYVYVFWSVMVQRGLIAKHLRPPTLMLFKLNHLQYTAKYQKNKTLQEREVYIYI
jgi:hypothetical protein